MSWREFQYNLRPIALLSVGGVVFTTLAVAAAAHWLMDLEWPIGLLLGAIISPPDAIAPLSIARNESLDEYALSSKAKDWRTMRPRLSFIALPWGPLASLFVLASRRNVCRHSRRRNLVGHRRRLANVAVETVGERSPDRNSGFDLNTLLAFWPPVHLGGSGVLATLTAGLYVVWNGPQLISPATRLQGVFFLGVLHLCD